jgi:hypothetical protein
MAVQRVQGLNHKQYRGAGGEEMFREVRRWNSRNEEKRFKKEGASNVNHHERSSTRKTGEK